MNPVVQIEVRGLYGKDVYYPHNDQAQRFTRLLNQKTLTVEDLTIIKEMGFVVERKHVFTSDSPFI